MTKLHTSIAAASLLVLAGLAQAQQAPDASKPNRRPPPPPAPPPARLK
jgi:hypothetical protein